MSYFGKDYDELNNFVDEEARALAHEQDMLAAIKMKAAEDEIVRARELEEAKARERAATLEAESKLVI